MIEETSPSAATRSAFLAALESPLVLNQSTAASKSPFVSESAVLQSIMPAPVCSRSSLTIETVISAIVAPFPHRVGKIYNLVSFFFSSVFLSGCFFNRSFFGRRFFKGGFICRRILFRHFFLCGLKSSFRRWFGLSANIHT